MRWCRC